MNREINTKKNGMGFYPLEIMPREGDVFVGDREGEVVYMITDVGGRNSQSIIMRTLYKEFDEALRDTTYNIRAGNGSFIMTGSARISPSQTNYDQLNIKLNELESKELQNA